MKIIFSLVFFVLSFFGFFGQALGSTAQVQDVFIDIDSSYEYLGELQQLYDRGMIVTDASRRFNPSSLLDRDEFVGITMEVICEKCIQPQTEISLLQRYADSQAYFDVPKTNPYFYCIEEADDKDYVRGYGISVRCENGTGQDGERPFCPDNRILLEEAIAVLLRNSGIFTIEDNQRITQDIRTGIITDSLASDTPPTDSLGEPYTFYGYLRKALDFQITEFDTAGNSETLRLLELDANGNINPKKFITREEFLRMAYIIFKSNNCIDSEDNGFALAIDIWEKECSPGDTDCNLSNLDDSEDTYDFTPDIEGFCEDGIENPNGYFWRFYNTSNGQEFFRYGEYLDDVALTSDGVWQISLRVTDRCGNSSQVYSTIVAGDSDTPPESDTQIDVAIIIYDAGCTGPSANCEEIDFYEEGESGDEFDFEGRVSTSCTIGNLTYNWTFSSPTNNQTLFRTGYIDNFEFLTAGEWLIVLEVTDGCGNTGREQENFIVSDSDTPPESDTQIDVAIIIYDAGCTGPSANCEEIDFYEEGESGDEFDFEGRVSTSCTIGNLTYNWTFSSPTNNQTLFRTGYIDNFEFLTAGEWLIVLEVTDGCGNTGREQENFIVGDSNAEELGLSVDIIANPIYGFTDLRVDFEAIISGGIGPFIYSWDFGTGDTNVGRLTEYIYIGEGAYRVRLTVTDSQGRTGESTVVIQVLDRDRCLQDSDNDGINDCDDLCPTIAGPVENMGCPIFERICDADCGCPDGYECSDSNPLTCGSGVCRPISIQQSCLFSPSVGAIFGSSLCNSCPCLSELNFLSDMRRCDLVFPAITSPDGQNIYSRGQAVIVPER